MPDRDLRAALRWHEVDKDDLEVVVHWHFPMARHDTDDRHVDYFRDGEHVLTARFGSSDLGLATLEAAPALREQDVARLAERLARSRETTGIRTHRRLLYSNVLANGCWQYEGGLGRLQLLPPPATAPDVASILGDHPLVLEYEVRLCGDNLVDQARADRLYRKYALALAGLVTHIQVPDRQRQLWAFPFDAEPRARQSLWATAVYWTMGPSAQAVPGWRSEFTPLDGVEPLATLPLVPFLERRGIGPEDDQLILPETLAESLDRLAALDAGRQDAFLRSAYWLNHAYAVWDLSYSASYIAVAQAIECLLPDARTVYCDACSRPHEEPSIGARFRSWVDQNAPGEEPRKSLYSLRSSLSHGSLLLRQDIAIHGLQPRSSTEMDSARIAMRAARVGLTNWLLGQGSEHQP